MVWSTSVNLAAGSVHARILYISNRWVETTGQQVVKYISNRWVGTNNRLAGTVRADIHGQNNQRHSIIKSKTIFYSGKGT